MTLAVDRNIYDDACISKVVFEMSDRCSFERKLKGDEEEITALPKDGKHDENMLQKVFFDKLNDYKLRGIIEKETHDIRTILYAKAFGESEELGEEGS